jgi:hypothetical protein
MVHWCPQCQPPRWKVIIHHVMMDPC